MSTLAAKPTRPAAKFDNAKKRPRIVFGIARPIRSIQAGMRKPPTPVITSSISSVSHRVKPAQRSAVKKASSAITRNGTRSHGVHLMRNGSLRVSVSVWPAANSEGRNQPSVITAGMAPMRTLGAPSQAAKAGRMVDWEANVSATMNRP